MATNTSKTYLNYKTTELGTFAKLVDITSYPDIFAPPGKLDITTLSDTQRKYIPDIKDVSDLVFGCLYDSAEFDTVAALQGNQYWYQLEFGDAGAEGTFEWQGDIFITPKGGQVGAVREGEITCYPATDIVKA